jgi:hypothetical protein
MSEQSNLNVLRYTGISYEDIKSQIDAALKGDPRFENFVDSALYKIVLNIFAGTTDLSNYYIERTAEEMYLDTAQHLSSIILGANQIGYVVRRPTPAYASLNVILRGPLNITGGDKLSIRFKDPLVFNGKKYILKYAYEYTFTASEASNAVSDTWVKNFTQATISDSGEVSDIEMLQGEQKTYQIYPESQAGQKWQRYNIEDPFISNLYGTEDLGSGELVSDRNLTQVFVTDVGEDVGTGNEYHINRKSLTAEDYTVQAIRATATSTGTSAAAIRTCLIKTNKDTTADIYFGDGISTASGPTVGQRIDVIYFATEGSDANQTGVIGNRVTWNGDALINGTNINDKIEFYLKTNIRGGADIEDKESIRLNAPGVFQSGDRLVTRNDYKYYLKTITNPLSVQHSVAWGEGEEARARGVGAIFQLFNAVIISAMGSMYKQESNSTTGKSFVPKNILFKTTDYKDSDDIDTTFIQSAAGIGSYSEQSYYDLYIKNDALDYLNYIYFDTNAPVAIKEFLDNINDKSQATVKNFYVTPIVQGFNLTGTVYVKGLTDLVKIKDKVENNIFTYLKNNNDFEKPIYISQMVDIIKNFNEVNYCDVSFEPIDVDAGYKVSIDISNDVVSSSADYDPADIVTIQNAAVATLSSYLPYDITLVPNPTSAYLDINTSATGSYTNSSQGQPEGIKTFLTSTQRLSGYSERSFYEYFARPYFVATSGIQRLTDLSGYAQTNDFRNFIAKVNSSFKMPFRQNMLDEKGNIINFSFPMEIAHVFTNLVYAYSNK